ncbi:Crp/Fnr family transcriptional regulator [Alcaligenaceae bacterium]|nr:Crp/Fnr family transcriptional regulator [Alcaligenaceae bacterium]
MICTPDPNNAATHDERTHALCVSRVPIFNHLPHEALAVIAGKATMRSYGSGEVIHRSGDPSEQLFIVHQGKVKVYRLSEGGKEQLVRILLPGNFIGELALFSATDHDSYAETMQPSMICTIQRVDIRDLLLSYPDISLHVLAELSRRLGVSEKQTAVIATEPVTTRIALYLADLADQGDTCTFSLPMARKDLASFLGTTPETISRKFGDFEQAGIIRQMGPRKIAILDLDALLLV